MSSEDLGYKSTSETKSIVPADNPKPKERNFREFFFIKNVTKPPSTVDKPANEDKIKAIR